MKNITEVIVHQARVDLCLRLEHPVYSWPDREEILMRRFSFPIRCLDQIYALAKECEQTTRTEALALVKARRRAIQWS